MSSWAAHVGPAALGAGMCAALTVTLAFVPLGRRPAATTSSAERHLPGPRLTRRFISRLRRPPGVLVVTCLGVSAVAAGRPALGLASVVIALTLRRLTLTARRARAARTDQQQVVLALRALRADLDSGRDPASAVAEGRAALDRSVRVTDALDAAITVSGQTGAPLAQLVARLAAVETARADAAHELDAALAGPRTSGRLLAVLPAAGCLLGSLSGARTIAFLLGTGAGGACLVLGVLLDAAGLLWLDRLAAGAGPTKDAAEDPAENEAAPVSR